CAKTVGISRILGLNFSLEHRPLERPPIQSAVTYHRAGRCSVAEDIPTPFDCDPDIASLLGARKGFPAIDIPTYLASSIPGSTNSFPPISWPYLVDRSTIMDELRPPLHRKVAPPRKIGPRSATNSRVCLQDYDASARLLQPSRCGQPCDTCS